MKYLIVNADDFGYSYGVNKGIVEAHTSGIVTSTSVMVDAIAAHEAAELNQFPNLSVGLHFAVTSFDNVQEEFERQVEKFNSIIGTGPDHIDTHKIHTTETGFRETLQAYSSAQKIPVRDYGFAKYIDIFFGFHSGGDVSVTQLKKAIDQATDEYNEIMCHVGYADDYLREHSSYNEPREQELKAICAPSIKTYLKEKGLELVNWTQLNKGNWV
jgi:predicted glycoside hydrolase/deacetylase ChbG (UPF0249 family)